MRTSKALIAAIPLSLVLVAAIAALLAFTPGTFGFHSWPTSPVAAPRENAVVIDEPLVTSRRERLEPRAQIARAQRHARRSARSQHVALVASADRLAAGATPSARGQATNGLEVVRDPAS